MTDYGKLNIIFCYFCFVADLPASSAPLSESLKAWDPWLGPCASVPSRLRGSVLEWVSRTRRFESWAGELAQWVNTCCISVTTRVRTHKPHISQCCCAETGGGNRRLPQKPAGQLARHTPWQTTKRFCLTQVGRRGPTPRGVLWPPHMHINIHTYKFDHTYTIHVCISDTRNAHTHREIRSLFNLLVEWCRTDCWATLNSRPLACEITSTLWVFRG